MQRVGFDRPQWGQCDFDRWPSLGGRPDGRRQAHVGLLDPEGGLAIEKARAAGQDVYVFEVEPSC